MTRAQRINWHNFCAEPLHKIEHYEEALAEGFAGWCMHHRLEIQPDGTKMSKKQLIDKDLYYERPASELVFMRRGEHISLHWLGKHRSEETRKKMSAAKRGKNHPLFGKHHASETRQKLSQSLKSKTWWNNGVSNKRSKECPGPEWKRGQLKKTGQA